MIYCFVNIIQGNMPNLLKYIKICLAKEIWKNHNHHNGTFLNECNYTNLFIERIKKNNLISVGKMTYGGLNVYSSNCEDEKLVIGDYCSIASNAIFILSGEHPYSCASTYPFKVKCFNHKYEATSKGPIIVEDDVWIGDRAMILSGVHIHQGAIVAAGSIVVKDVEAYSIVGGVPARHIKYRFSQAIITQLKKIDWGKIEVNNEIENILTTDITEKNVKHIVDQLQKQVKK